MHQHSHLNKYKTKSDSPLPHDTKHPTLTPRASRNLSVREPANISLCYVTPHHYHHMIYVGTTHPPVVFCRWSSTNLQMAENSSSLHGRLSGTADTCSLAMETGGEGGEERRYKETKLVLARSNHQWSHATRLYRLPSVE